MYSGRHPETQIGLETAFQSNGLVAPGVPLTLSILRLKSVPAPESGTKSFEKADIRAVLIVPGPGRMPRATCQLPVEVSPAGSTKTASRN